MKINKIKIVAISMKHIIYIVLTVLLFLNYTVSCEGFTVKSITANKIISNNDDLRNANITIDLVLNDGGQYFSGTIDDFSSIPGVNIKTPVTVQISRIQEQIIYQIADQGTLWRYPYVFHDASSFENGAKCDPKPAYCYRIDTGRFAIGEDRVLVINRVPAGSYGRFQNPDISWLGTINVIINGTQYKQQIGSGESSRGAIHFKNLSVMWIGSLVTGRGTPNQDLYVGTSNNNRWKVAPVVYYESYIKSLTETDIALQNWQKQNDDATVFNDYVCKDDYCSAVLNKILLHNILVDILMTKNTRIEYGSVTASSSYQGDNGNVYDSIDRPIANPEIIIQMRASELNVVMMSGIPKITSIIVPKLGSGDNNGSAQIFFDNIAFSKGTFRARMNGSAESNSVSVLPNESGMLFLVLRSGLNGSENKTENVEVYDINSGVSDNKQFQIIQEQPKLFIPNETRIYNNIVTKSDEKGLVEYKVMDECKGIWKYNAGKYGCTELTDIKTQEIIPQPVVTSFILTPQSESKESALLSFIVMFLLGVVFILVLSMFVGGGRSSRKKGLSLATYALGILIILILTVLFWPEINEIKNRLIIEIIKQGVKL